MLVYKEKLNTHSRAIAFWELIRTTQLSSSLDKIFQNARDGEEQEKSTN